MVCCCSPLHLDSADALRGFLRPRKVPFLELQRYIDQADQHGNLHQRADHRGKSRPVVDPEDTDGHRDGQLKIVAGGGKGERFSPPFFPFR